MSKTVEEHFESCKQVSQVIDDANALLVKSQNELRLVRDMLELLKDYHHPKLKIPVNYRPWRPEKADTLNGAQISDIGIKRINELLGDRA